MYIQDLCKQENQNLRYSFQRKESKSHGYMQGKKIRTAQVQAKEENQDPTNS